MDKAKGGIKMLNVVHVVMWSMAVSLIGLGSAISLNKYIPQGYHSPLSTQLERRFSDTPRSVTEWVANESTEPRH